MANTQLTSRDLRTLLMTPISLPRSAICARMRLCVHLLRVNANECAKAERKPIASCTNFDFLGLLSQSL